MKLNVRCGAAPVSGRLGTFEGAEGGVESRREAGAYFLRPVLNRTFRELRGKQFEMNSRKHSSHVQARKVA